MSAQRDRSELVEAGAKPENVDGNAHVVEQAEAHRLVRLCVVALKHERATQVSECRDGRKSEVTGGRTSAKPLRTRPCTTSSAMVSTAPAAMRAAVCTGQGKQLECQPDHNPRTTECWFANVSLLSRYTHCG